MKIRDEDIFGAENEQPFNKELGSFPEPAYSISSPNFKKKPMLKKVNSHLYSDEKYAQIKGKNTSGLI